LETERRFWREDAGKVEQAISNNLEEAFLNVNARIAASMS